jgi:putative peptide zinc metalloprotease protein
MNLVEALNVALPELPSKVARKGAPRLDPRVSAREHLEGDVPVIFAHIPGSGEYFRFTPEQWRLLELFDGLRSYEEIDAAYQEQTGTLLTEDWIRSYATDLDFTGFWYKTPQERNAEVMRKLGEARHFDISRHLKIINVADIRFPACDQARYLPRVGRALRFVYSSWVTAVTLALFAFMIYVFVDRWSEIGRDTLEFYNFTDKGFADLVQFWVMFLVLVFCHETAHGVTCKHFGGGVHQMGFNLVFLQPCFYVDVSELWVYATRWQRVAAMLAGLWVELIFCALATIAWWGTAPGTSAHEYAYEVMLLTGVGSVLFNLNPLIKLDGYYILTEILRIPDLKEQSTSLLTNWVKRNIFRLPVVMEYVPHRRRWLYVPYAILSGVYSYGLLFFVIRFARNVFRGYSQEWAFVPALLLGYFIFRSRIRALVRFMKILYLDKRELLLSARNSPRVAALGVAAALLLVAPLWHDSVDGRFLLEPAKHAVVRAYVPGIVEQTSAEEGQPVLAGAALVKLRNLAMETQAEEALADLQVAGARSTQARLHYTGVASAEHEQEQLAVRSRILNQERGQLSLVSPIDGVVLTPRISDLMGSYLAAGTTVLDVADLSSMKARIYVSEVELHKVREAASARVYVDALHRSMPGGVSWVGPAATDVEEGVISKQDYKGMILPHYYAATVLLQNPDGALRIGMSGTARIYRDRNWRERRSLAGFAWEGFRNFLQQKLW